MMSCNGRWLVWKGEKRGERREGKDMATKRVTYFVDSKSGYKEFGGNSPHYDQ